MEQTYITGTVDRFLFYHHDNDFIICVVTHTHGSSVVKGHAPHIYVGQEIVAYGSWTMHHKFGQQFHATSIVHQTPHSITGIKKYLASGLIKGIGATYAERIVDHFGTDALRVIDEDPQRLCEIPGIGTKRMETIQASWHEQRSISHIMVFLQDKGISNTYATKLYKVYGEHTVATLQDNPYKAAYDVRGIGFKVADTIAYKLGFAYNSMQRITAGVMYALSMHAQSGHLYATVAHLKDMTAKLLELRDEDRPLIKQALHTLYEHHKISVITYDQDNYIGPVQHYATEQRISRLLQQLIYTPQKATKQLLYDEPTEDHTQQLHPQQRSGISMAWHHKVSVITGGPGTGKTTLVKQLLDLCRSHNMRCKLAAPTGRAAKRLIESTGFRASTLHRLLHFDVSTMQFQYNQEHPLPVDMLIIDEVSMIDIFLFLSLLRAVPDHAHLVLIGDKDQLPSVGPGNVLQDIITSECIPVTRLTHVFRQSEDALIAANAHRVNHGQFPYIPKDNRNNDFMFIKEQDPQRIQEHIRRALFITSRIYQLAPSDMHVLTPMNRGAAGTQHLNSYIQDMLNPQAEQTIRIGTHLYKTGDRIMQTRNNYEKRVYNGDLGIISYIDHEHRQISVAYPEHTVVYHAGEISDITHAYAVTIHKSQGSEYPGVIIPIFMQHYTLLQRNLLYTAITRAQQLCILIGDPRAIGMCIKSNTSQRRVTFLPHFLREQCSIQNR